MPNVATINNTQLDSICIDVIARAKDANLYFHVLLQVMYNTGLRITEVYELSRWSRLDPDSMLVQLAKGSGERRIPRADLPDEFLNVVDNYPLTNWQFTKRQVQYFVRNNTGLGSVQVGTKQMASHLYRYNFCRKLQADGYPVSYVRDQIIHSSSNVTSGYLGKPLEYIP